MRCVFSAALLFTALPLAVQAATCGLDLNTAYGNGNGSVPMTLVFPFQIMWKPYFNLNVNGAQVATLQSVCPNPTLSMDMTTPAGGLVLKTANQIGLFAGWFTGGIVVKAYDCNGNFVGTVVETFANTFINQFGFSNLYTIYDANDNQIGTCVTPSKPVNKLHLVAIFDACRMYFSPPMPSPCFLLSITACSTSGARFFQNTIEVMNNNGVVVGAAAWSWTAFAAYGGSSIVISQWTPGAGSPARAELIIALAQIGFLRYVSSDGGMGVDQCSKFIYIGIPCLIIFQLCFCCISVGMVKNKALGALLALVFYPGVAIMLTAMLLGIALTVLYLPFYALLRCLGKLDKSAKVTVPLITVMALLSAGIDACFNCGGGPSQRAAGFHSGLSARSRRLRGDVAPSTNATPETSDDSNKIVVQPTGEPAQYTRNDA